MNYSPKYPRRKRSTSLDSKVIKNYRENRNLENPLKKYASSSSLFNSEEKYPEPTVYNSKFRKKSMDYNCYFLFVNWHKDFRNVKSMLLSIHDPNIFKNEFPKYNNLNMREQNPPVVYIIYNSQKIDNEYETFVINDYELRLKELWEWSSNENEELFQECSRGLEVMNKEMDELEQLSLNEDSDKVLVQNKSNVKKYSESIALIIQNKNQPMLSFLPREHQGYLNKLKSTCECELIYFNQDKKIERNYKSFQRIGILTKIDISIFTRNNLKLKDYYVLRHVYLGQCNDKQIANIDSCLRIGSPIGNDLIIRFQNPQTRNEWNTYINEQITAYQESIKNITTSITVFNDTNPSSSVPLLSKSITVNGNTNGLSLKKLAMAAFDVKDADINDLSIIFLIKNKENILNDEMLILVLQDHVNKTQDNNCTKSCLDSDKLNVNIKIIYYLRSNRGLNEHLSKDFGKNKKLVLFKTKEEIKIKLNKYNISLRWIDNEMPNWLMNLLADLYIEGPECEGIFRISGLVVQSDEYINQIYETDDLKIEASINTKASILKKFISVIEGSLLTSINKENFAHLASEINSVDDFLMQKGQQTKLVGWINKIPSKHLNFFRHVLVVLNNIIENSKVNQMNHANLAACFSQNLFKHLSDDAIKINRVFECILHSIPNIVDQATYKNIVQSYEKLKTSNSDEECRPKSDDSILLDIEDNFSQIPVDSTDEIKLPPTNLQSLAPLKRRKGLNRTNTKYNQSSAQNPSTDLQNMKTSFYENRRSLCDSLIISETNNEFDKVDSKSQLANTVDGSNLVKMRLIPKERKLLRSHNTFNNVIIPENLVRNAYRVQTSDKNQKNIESEINDSFEDNDDKDNKNQMKSISKLRRSANKVIPKTRSRSQTRSDEHGVLNSNTIYQGSNDLRRLDNELSSKNANKPLELKERKRSSSACRVPQLREQFESNLNPAKPQIPLKRYPLKVSESQIVSKIIKEIEDNKLVAPKEVARKSRSRNVVNGPIRPSHNLQGIGARLEISKPLASTFQSLDDILSDENLENITYI